jgi:hypothetical protein
MTTPVKIPKIGLWFSLKHMGHAPPARTNACYIKGTRDAGKTKELSPEVARILGSVEMIYHLLENLGRLWVLREAPLSMYPPVLFSSSSSLDSSDLHLDPPLPAAPSPTEDFLPKLQIRVKK